MMSKRIKAILAGFVTAVAISPAVQAADIKDRNLKIAAVLQTDSPYVISAQKVADLIREKSGGKIKARVYAGGTLGGDVTVISSLQGGTIEMTMVAAGLLSGINKEFILFSQPLLFNEPKEAYAVLDGPVGKKFLDLLPSKGLIGLGWWEYGHHNLTNSKRPVTKLEDIQGLKIRVQQIPVLIDTFNALGANAVPMPFPEVFTALETKTVDAQANTFASILATKFNEVQKYVSTTRHVYDPIVVLFSKKIWDGLSDDERKIIQDSVAEVTPSQRQLNQETEGRALEELKTKGMIVAEFPPEERERMRTKLKPVREKYEKSGDAALAEQLNAEIEKVRGVPSK
jgi:TRAP-type transport system periplasmic protein